MKTYQELYGMVEQRIQTLSISGHPNELYDPIAYMLSLGGKRLRPVLVLMANNACNGNIEDAIPAALAVEVFHNFTLVHDDIMDNAHIRRGKPTVHVKWNETVGILSGDLMMIKATQLLCESSKGDLRQLLNVFNQTAVQVCEGQQIDMNFEGREDVTEDEYIDMITLKTAVLLGGSLQIGALIAGSNNQDAQHLYDFGKFMGVAFQIQDDILDSFGDGAAVGKKIGGDIASNKKTILLIKALERASADQAEKLKTLLYELDVGAKIQAILSLYQELSVKEYAQSLKQLYLDKAFESLQKVQIEELSKNQLRQTALDLMERIS